VAAGLHCMNLKLLGWVGTWYLPYLGTYRTTVGTQLPTNALGTSNPNDFLTFQRDPLDISDIPVLEFNDSE
jgi:hypothetical protein